MINTLTPIFITMETLINPISRRKEVHWIFEALTAQHWSFLPRLKEFPVTKQPHKWHCHRNINTGTAQCTAPNPQHFKEHPKKGKIIQSWPSMISSKSWRCSCDSKHEDLFPTFKITSFPCQVFLIQVNTSATGNALTANNIILNLVNKQSPQRKPLLQFSLLCHSWWTRAPEGTS